MLTSLRLGSTLSSAALAVVVWAAPPVGAAAQDHQDAVARRDEPEQPGESALEAAAPQHERDRNGWAALPLASYSPETHLGLGAFGIYFFRLGDEPAETRPSSAAVVGLYTTRGQAIVELIPELYLDNERWHLWTKLDLRSFPDSFWGIGNDMPDDQEERYSQVSYRARAWLRRQLAPGFYVGMRADAQYLNVTETELNGLFDSGGVPGADGGRTVGLGPTLAWDDRDNAVQSRSGAFYQASLMTWQPFLGSQYAFTRLTIDLRHFFPIYGEHVIGAQLYGELNAGHVPFHQMALLGGQNLMRGYFEGRYRDRFMLAAQVEYRYPIWWRFSGVAFAGLGDVSPRVVDFEPSEIKVAGGAGLRFTLNEQERLNVRLDLGVGPGTFGAYLGIAEAF